MVFFLGRGHWNEDTWVCCFWIHCVLIWKRCWKPDLWFGCSYWMHWAETETRPLGFVTLVFHPNILIDASKQTNLKWDWNWFLGCSLKSQSVRLGAVFAFDKIFWYYYCLLKWPLLLFLVLRIFLVQPVGLSEAHEIIILVGFSCLDLSLPIQPPSQVCRHVFTFRAMLFVHNFWYTDNVSIYNWVFFNF